MIKNIEPVQCFPSEATQIRVDDCHLVLDVSASFQWALLDAAGVVVAGPGRKLIEGEEYAAWQGDDNYPVELVAEKVGVTIIPDEETPEQE